MPELLPLSVGQQSLWLLYRLAPESSAYNDAGAGRLAPAPDIGALRDAVHFVVQRHDMLRSLFVEREGCPARVIRPTGTELVIREVTGMSDAELSDAAAAVARQPFELATDGPLRVVLLRRADDAVLVVANHHIATDATSQWLIWRDLLAAYAAFAAGGRPELPDLAGDFQQQVTGEHQQLTAKRAHLEEFWRGVCVGAEAGVLPLDHPRPQRSVFIGASCSRRLPDELADRVRCTAAGLGVTPFALLLGTFQALVYRHSSQPAFLLACPTSTRRHRRSRDVVGYFVNTLLVRATLDAGSTFAAAARTASQQVTSGTAHAGYPYPLLRSTYSARPGPAATPGRTPRPGPLFRIAVTMVTAARFGRELDELADGAVGVPLGDLRVHPYDVPRLEGQCDLNVEITRAPHALSVVFRYDTALFDAATVERLLDCYLRFIEVAATDPDGRVSRVPLMAPVELARMLALAAGR